jgi:lipopolysaccharide transport system ATP-binding protein
MPNEVVIQVENLGKSYLIGHEMRDGRGQESFREAVGRQARSMARAALDISRGRQIIQGNKIEEFWALNDVSFEVKRGEVLGIIGRNGAGKSTLLKILSRITEPTSGEIDVYGRIGSLLEVGTGFHPELTGRENIYLNGQILGMRKREIDKQFDAIVDFSGVEKFLDTPVKRYSSGMYVRLAFAVAAHLRSEILIIDEVLAVGDAEFQEKCLGKMKDASTDGRTVLFVSHNMGAVNNLCSTGLLLQRGMIARFGYIADVVQMYLGSGAAAASRWARSVRKPQAPLIIEYVTCAVEGTDQAKSLLLQTRLRTQHQHAPAMLAFDITDSVGEVLMQSLPRSAGFLRSSDVLQDVCVRVDLPPLIPGRYDITVWTGPHNSETYDLVPAAVAFEITQSPTEGRTFPHTRDHGAIVPASRVVSTISVLEAEAN